MKLRLSTIGINTDSFPPILVTDTGVQIMATRSSIRQALFEAQQYLAGLETIEHRLASDSIVEQDKMVDDFLAVKQKQQKV